MTGFAVFRRLAKTGHLIPLDPEGQPVVASSPEEACSRARTTRRAAHNWRLIAVPLEHLHEEKR